MYGRDMMGYAGGRRMMVPYGGVFPRGFRWGWWWEGCFCSLLQVLPSLLPVVPDPGRCLPVGAGVRGCWEGTGRGCRGPYAGEDGPGGGRGEQGAGASRGARAAGGTFAGAGGFGDLAHGRRGGPDALRSRRERSSGGKGARRQDRLRALGRRQASADRRRSVEADNVRQRSTEHVWTKSDEGVLRGRTQAWVGPRPSAGEDVREG